MITATLDKQNWVEVLEMDTENGTAWVRDEDGEEVEVSIERLDNIEEPFRHPRSERGTPAHISRDQSNYMTVPSGRDSGTLI